MLDEGLAAQTQAQQKFLKYGDYYCFDGQNINHLKIIRLPLQAFPSLCHSNWHYFNYYPTIISLINTSTFNNSLSLSFNVLHLLLSNQYLTPKHLNQIG